jgi:very-short-patch-repair endonuclease
LYAALPHPTPPPAPKILHRAGELRAEPSPAEAKLWAYLRTLRKDGIHFRRQHAIGPYITDFCAPRQRLVIEVDGSQHLWQAEYDAARTAFLESKGYRVVRFWNSSVMNKIEAVMGAILEELETSIRKE